MINEILETKSILVEYDLQFFAKDGPGGEKTEEPTSKKKEDARKKGQVALSKEVTTAFTLLSLFILIRIFYGFIGQIFTNTFEYIYNDIPECVKLYDGYIQTARYRSIVIHVLLTVLLCCAPFFITGVVVSLLADYIQIGFKVTSEPIKPKFNKLNPISGMKKIFSVRSLVNLGLSILKLLIIFIIIYTYFTGMDYSLFVLYDMPLKQAIGLMGTIVIDLGIRIAAVYMIVAVIDLIYQRKKHHDDLMMTKQEVKDEYKNTEGDPQIKGKQRQRMREASMRRMMQELPKADVVITNPTHYAVAILYEADKYEAPRVIAKGSDYLAQRIKDVAKENDIEIVENKPLARMLYANVEIGDFVPPELYKAVAEVLAFVYHLKGKA
ncbi:MAG: flagellar biosynthesis protein FlhB [Butyrivibrio sp.]|nr:flagellar biosynthesis protein FlhB [Butyrivibrio sp.]